jgi:hypothetical protein
VVDRIEERLDVHVVYASQLGLFRSTPRKTYPLTATPGGAGFEPAGLRSKVSLRNLTSHHVVPPLPSFAWRTNRRAALASARGPWPRSVRSVSRTEAHYSLIVTGWDGRASPVPALKAYRQLL